jgi:hypothetical protein
MMLYSGALKFFYFLLYFSKNTVMLAFLCRDRDPPCVHPVFQFMPVLKRFKASFSVLKLHKLKKRWTLGTQGDARGTAFERTGDGMVTVTGQKR